ncbi:hypothetical protein HMJ29_00200 [Hymenobacter taeanensis]|uniref:HTH araC/xylS-type domain-containing protein n=1 Tax=Hymenobacter taeanensis TaxID=2735321 RepID=A0A6M6BBQ8_9BACT|nr:MULTISPECIES: hypothetical protein [Hymenobacter]QJX45439.1 hypothetical protein HMJ29_00200 [Hymenobacter taeanensis]UOQ81317.1 hypothetical protein MUN83_00505 [Hymenobacter sp. 5414T-23]
MGQSTQLHSHQGLIIKGCNLLPDAWLTINRMALQRELGYLQYFARLFKSKTCLTPATFRFSAQ